MKNQNWGLFSLAMTITTPVLTDSKTLNEVVNCLIENIPIPAQGKCEQKNIWLFCSFYGTE